MHYRKIYEQHYGVKIPKGYHVHHKDMNHANDDPLNLEALHPDEHAKKHGFLNNFIMAGANAEERRLAAMRKPEAKQKLLDSETCFTKGHSPWNKGTTGLITPGIRGRLASNKHGTRV